MKKTIPVISVLLAIPVLGVASQPPQTTYPTQLQTQAVKILEKQPVFHGKNGFVDLYTLGYDIPENKKEDVLQKDLKAYTDHKPSFDLNNPSPLWQSALSSYKNTLSHIPSYKGCVFSSSRPSRKNKTPHSCIDQIKKNPQAFSYEVATREPLLQQALSLSQYDYFASPFPIRSDIPLPTNGFVSLGFIPTFASWQFAQGYHDLGMSSACQGIKIGQSLVTQPDNLISGMVGGSLLSHSSQVLADQMSRLPVTKQLPQICQDVLKTKIQPQKVVCNNLLAEGRFYIFSLRASDIKALAAKDESISQEQASKMYNQALSEAFTAPRFTQFCNAKTQQQVSSNTPRTHQKVLDMEETRACKKNPLGCVFDSMSMPNYNSYAHRLQSDVAVFEKVVEISHQQTPVSQKSVTVKSFGPSSPKVDLPLRASQQ